MRASPVLLRELRAIARARRTYALRVLVGSLVLVAFWVHFLELRRAGNQTTADFGELRQSLRGAASYFWIVEALSVLLLIPLLAAGSISGESRRGSLDGLLTSPLTGLEIVLGKAVSALLVVAMLLAIALPIQATFSILGGPELSRSGLMALGLLGHAFLLVGLSLAVSARRLTSRDSIVAVLLLELLWLGLPDVCTRLPPELADPLAPVADWVRRSSPVGLFATIRGPSDQVLPDLLGLLAKNLAGGLAGLLLAATWIRSRAESRRMTRPVGAVTGFDRPLHQFLLDRFPLVWKETRRQRSSGVSPWLGRLLQGLALATLVLQLAGPLRASIGEVARFGYGSIDLLPGLLQLGELISLWSVGIFIAGSIAVGYGGARGIAAERERNTWETLISSLYDGRELLLARVFGSIWCARWPGTILLGLWAIGVLTGALHPIGAILGLGVLASAWTFVALLGTCISLHSQTVGGALAWTLIAGLFASFGYLFCAIPVIPNSLIALSGCSPYLVYSATLSFLELDEWIHPSSHVPRLKLPIAKSVPTVLLGIAVHAAAAWVLLQLGLWSIDRERTCQVDGGGNDGQATGVEDESRVGT